MEKIIRNDDNLREEDINETEVRVKTILVNDQKEVLVGYAGNRYQFIGGHVEKNEELLKTAEREILEETGISLSIDKNTKPIAKYTAYWKDHPIENFNKKTEIYYYLLRCNEKVNYENTNYTKEEKQGNFEVRKIKADNLEKEIIENYKKYKEAEGIGKEMVNVIRKIKV